MKKNRFSILDIAIILTLVFFVAGAAIKAGTVGSDIFTAKDKKSVIYILADDDSKSLGLVLKEGDVVIDTKSGTAIGTVDGLVEKRNKQYVRNGDFYEIVHTDTGADAVIRINVNIIENENGAFMPGNIFIAPGMQLSLQTDNAVFSGTVTKIK